MAISHSVRSSGYGSLQLPRRSGVGSALGAKAVSYAPELSKYDYVHEPVSSLAPSAPCPPAWSAWETLAQVREQKEGDNLLLFSFILGSDRVPGIVTAFSIS